MKTQAQHRSRATLRGRRGTAEIELLMVIPLLLVLLFITKGTLQLGEARLRNAFDAEQQASTDDISSAPPTDTNRNLQPIDGIASVRPGLPNRMHDREQSRIVTPWQHVPLNKITLTEHAAFAAPAWAYTAFPVHDAGGGFNDATATQ